MGLLLGIDLGTSSVKCILAADNGRILNISEKEYPIQTPQPNWSEQDPESWWQMTTMAIKELLSASKISKEDIQVISLSGQMHGTVFLGRDENAIRPAIIWADQRSSAQCQQVYQQIGYEQLAQITGSGVFPGFMLASLLWVQQHEPDIWEQIVQVIFPKDYVRLQLTGEISTEISDASSGLLVDIHSHSWSEVILNEFSIPGEILPPILGSYETAGALTEQAADRLGLHPGIPVVAGGGDQATGALGSGIIHPDVLTATIGTGGQLVTLLSDPRVDEQLRTHTFCHAIPESWYLLGATLSAGLAFRWLRDAVLQEKKEGAYKRMVKEAESVPSGAEGLVFLPYLLGERAAKQIVQPTGVFHGLSLHHDRSHLIRAVMEGIIFSMRLVFDIFLELGVKPEKIIASGGGARSDLWCQIMADIFQTPVVRLNIQEQSAIGAVILGGLGIRMYRDVSEACQTFVSYSPEILPQPTTKSAYFEQFERYKELYKITSHHK